MTAITIIVFKGNNIKQSSPKDTDKNCYLVVDAPKLPGPTGVVEERSEVKAVVIRAVTLSMVGRRHCGHLVAVH